MSASERFTDSSRALAAMLGFALLLLPFARSSSVRAAQSALDALRQRDQELEAIRAEQKKAAETQAKLKDEIDAIGEDRRKLNQALIDAAARLRDTEDRIAETEGRLKPLDDSERTLRQSLDGRRAIIAEVLAALQRIGRHPPPALMVRPEDALQSVRTAIMLGAVLPDMRVAGRGAGRRPCRPAARPQGDRRREGPAGRAIVAALTEERQRISLLIEERQKKQAETEKALEAERQQVARAGPPGRQSQRFDRQARAGPRQRQPRRAVARSAPTEAKDNRIDLAALNDPGRLDAGGRLCVGQGAACRCRSTASRIREFGAPDGLGGTEKGISIATRAGAQVTAPCDGWVVYAGPFRNYGQLLILNAGGGYHVVLAGMERISVDLGQFVLTGEPVAVMGSGSQVAASRRDRLQPTGALCRVPQRRYSRRSQPVVGGKRRRKGSRMMRKTSLILLGAAAGAALTLLATQPRADAARRRAPRRPPPTPTGSSICSATCSSACAPTTSRSRTTPS